MGIDKNRGANVHSKKYPPLEFFIFTINLFLFLKFFFFFFDLNIESHFAFEVVKKIALAVKKNTLKQKIAPNVDESKISKKFKFVVASAMDAANKNLICARKKTYMYKDHLIILFRTKCQIASITQTGNYIRVLCHFRINSTNPNSRI